MSKQAAPPLDKQTAIQVKSWMAQAQTFHKTGNLASAEVLYRQILEIDPDYFDALHMLAVIGYQTDQLDDAMGLFERAKTLRPESLGVLVNYGAALKKARKFEDALQVYDAALALNPEHPESLFNKAQVLSELHNYEESVTYYRRALTKYPDDADAYVALGNALQNLGRWQDAIAQFEIALSKNPNSAFAYVSMARIFRQREWLPTSIALYDKAIAIDPKDARSRTHRAMSLLKSGRLKEGWDSYEGRFWYGEERVARRPVPPMYWAGENLTGKTISVWPEQAIGDEVWYASMLPDLISRAGQVVLECSARLLPIFSRSFPQVKVIERIKDIEDFKSLKGIDYQISIGSLGRFFRPNLSSFPKRQRYLLSDAQKTQSLRQKYGRQFRVGLSWKSASKVIGKSKSSSLLEWEPLLTLPGVQFVNLQYGDCRDDLREVKERLGVDILNDESIDSLTDMDSFFSQVAAMDLVVSTSNTTVHVAGSLGVPTRLLLPKGKGGLWYWFLGREDCLWYSSVRICRDDNRLGSDETWARVLTRRVADEVAAMLQKSAA